MPYDPTCPPANAPLVSAAMRNQFNGLQTSIQAKASEDDCVGRTMACARNPANVIGLQMLSTPALGKPLWP
jgi:hypothetical protein